METKKRNLLIGISAGLIGLVLLALTMINPIMARLAPDKYILLSLLEMQKKADQEAKYTQAIQEKNKKTHLNFDIKDLSGLNDDYLKDLAEGLGLSISASSNEAQEIVIDGNLQKHGANLMDLSIYSSKDDLGIKIPGLLNQYVIVNLDQFKSNYDQTVLAAFLGRIYEDDISNFKGTLTQTRKAITGEPADSYNQLSKDYMEVSKTLAKTIDARFTGTTKVTLDHKEIKANSFSVHLDPKDLVDFQRDLIRASLRNDYIATNLELTSHIMGEDYKADQIQKLILEDLSNTQIEDVTINCLIDNKKQILQADLISKIRLDHELELEFYINHHISNGTLIQMKENQRQVFDAHLQIKKDPDTKYYNRSLVADITLDQDPSIHVKFSGDFSIENLKNNPLVVSDDQKLDLFSLKASQMLDLIMRLGTYFDINI